MSFFFFYLLLLCYSFLDLPQRFKWSVAHQLCSLLGLHNKVLQTFIGNFGSSFKNRKSGKWLPPSQSTKSAAVREIIFNTSSLNDSILGLIMLPGNIVSHTNTMQKQSLNVPDYQRWQKYSETLSRSKKYM